MAQTPAGARSASPAHAEMPGGKSDSGPVLHLRSLAQAPALIATLRGPDHVYEFVNERHIEVLGDRDYVGRPAREAIPEAIDQGLIDILDRVYASGEPFRASEMPLRFASGTAGKLEQGYYDFIYQPLRDERGAVSGIMIHAIDVTDEVQHRHRAERMASQYTAILNQMADGVIIVDSLGIISFQNEAAHCLLGAEGVGQDVQALLEKIGLFSLDGAPLAPEETWLARTVHEGQAALNIERRVRRPDGTEIVVHGSAKPVIADDGSPYGSVFTFRDITEQKRLEEARSAMAALVDSSSDSIITCNQDGIITSWDRGAEELYGYLRSDALGRPAGMLAPEGGAKALMAMLASVRNGTMVEHLETVRRHKNGDPIDVSVSISPIKDVAGRITGTVSIAHDIGERKRLERERTQHQQELTTRVLQAQEDERKRIARELHDETLQDLTTLLITLDVAERRLSGVDDDALSALARVRAIGRRTLDETRALAHSLRPPILDDIGLAAALDALGDEYAQTYALAVDVRTDLDEGAYLPPYLEIVVFRIAQEALTNACKHGGGTEAHVSFAVAEGVGTLCVADNGSGFDPEQKTADIRYSGLGLMGMRERADLVGGDLTIDTAPGVGTRVTLRIPAEARREHPTSVPQLDVEVPSQPRPIGILLVDDHAMVRDGLKLILESQRQFQVLGEAEDGRRALELVERLHPDLVVMDVAMPNLNGLDATRQIKRLYPNVKVLILTSHDNRQYVTQIVKTGADGCLLKRSAGTELITALETLAEGNHYVSPGVAGTVLDDYRGRIDRGRDDPLTQREREVVQLVAEGHTNQGIARKLGISVKTVETHRTNVMEKLGVADRTDLVKYAIREGMISAE